MPSIEVITLIGSISAIITAVWGVWYQTRSLKQRDDEIRHKIELDWNEFREKYTSTENRVYTWLEHLEEPIAPLVEPHTEIGFPYLAGAPVRQPELFYGRRDLLNEAIKCANGKQMASMFILGSRKSGKTSFFNFLEYSLADHYPNIVPVYLDAQTPLDSCENFYAYMLRETMLALEKRNKNIARSPDIPKEVSFETLSEFIERASHRQWRFLMLLDEFENLVKTDSLFNENFFSALRSIIHKGQISWIAASYRFVYMPNTTTSPFSNIIQTTHYVGALSPNDAHRLITEPAARFGHFYEKEDIDFILKIAGRIPYLIQKASLLLYQSHINGLRGKDARLNVQNTFVLEIQHYFDSQLFYLTGEECKTLFQVARQTYDDCNPVNLAILEKYGFIEQKSNEYKILGQVFDDYLYRRNKVEYQ